jgi:hypothetical protein
MLLTILLYFIANGPTFAMKLLNSHIYNLFRPAQVIMNLKFPQIMMNFYFAQIMIDILLIYRYPVNTYMSLLAHKANSKKQLQYNYV